MNDNLISSYAFNFLEKEKEIGVWLTSCTFLTRGVILF